MTITLKDVKLLIDLKVKGMMLTNAPPSKTESSRHKTL